MNLCTVGDVRIIAGILHHETGRLSGGKALPVDGETRRFPPGEDNLHLRDCSLLPEHEGRPLGGGGCTGSGGVAGAKVCHECSSTTGSGFPEASN